MEAIGVDVVIYNVNHLEVLVVLMLFTEGFGHIAEKKRTRIKTLDEAKKHFY